MASIHCQVRFADYQKWKENMDADADAQQKAGIFLKHLWRGVDDPNTAFFVCDIEDRQKVKAFLDPTSVAGAEKAAGASDFEWCFVEEISSS